MVLTRVNMHDSIENILNKREIAFVQYMYLDAGAKG